MINKVTATEKDKLINDIIDAEYEMFTNVQNMGGRASCQDNYDTFYVMRYSQHCIYSEDTLNSYKRDLDEAKAAGVNLATEKYSFMMAVTDPIYYEQNLEPYLPKISANKASLVDSIAITYMHCYEALEKVCPHVLKTGRDPYGGDYGASVDVYFRAELQTYSERTLQLISKDMITYLQNRQNPVSGIYDTTVRFYGFNGLQEAEQKLSAKG